jgi:hypothetical protein
VDATEEASVAEGSTHVDSSLGVVVGLAGNEDKSDMSRGTRRRRDASGGDDGATGAIKNSRVRHHGQRKGLGQRLV